MVDSWNHNFIIKSLDGVVGGLLRFPSMKCDIERLHRHGNLLLPPLEVMAGAEKAVVEYHTSLDFTCITAGAGLNPCLVQSWVGRHVRDVSLPARMGSKATV